MNTPEEIFKPKLFSDQHERFEKEYPGFHQMIYDSMEEYAKAYAPVPELSYSDKLFERYVVDARNEFVKIIVKHDSHIEAEHSRITEEGIKLRTACEDILIAYDQIKEKLAAPVPGKEETFLGVLEENYKAAKLLTDEDKIRPAQEVLLETYEDLISIYKHKYSKNGK